MVEGEALARVMEVVAGVTMVVVAQVTMEEGVTAEGGAITTGEDNMAVGGTGVGILTTCGVGILTTCAVEVASETTAVRLGVTVDPVPTTTAATTPPAPAPVSWAPSSL